MSTRIQRLMIYLSKKHINHEQHILKEKSIKDAHIYCILNEISTQRYGILLEKYISSKYNYTKNSASKCNGDCSNAKDNIEIKVSLGGYLHNKYNYVQIRISHDITYYIFTAFYLDESNVEQEGELFIFKINKDEMIKLISKYGQYAHGTIKKNGLITIKSLMDLNNTKEYALRPQYNDKCWNELLNFKINENAL